MEIEILALLSTLMGIRPPGCCPTPLDPHSSNEFIPCVTYFHFEHNVVQIDIDHCDITCYFHLPVGVDRDIVLYLRFYQS